MDRHFKLLGTKKRITELLLSESGAVDVKKAIGLGTVVTGSMLAAVLLAPTNANADACGCNVQAGEHCCIIYNPLTYWCCPAGQPHCGIHFGDCSA
jgi:hypothetical protein